MIDIWRVEDDWNDDGIDYWDFLSLEEAEEYKNILIESEEFKEDQIKVRKLKYPEIVDTAIASYADILKAFPHDI